MRDEMDARIWVEHGPAFSADLDRLFGRIGAAARRLFRRSRSPERTTAPRGTGIA